jgi:hypothetical protein
MSYFNFHQAIFLFSSDRQSQLFWNPNQNLVAESGFRSRGS